MFELYHSTQPLLPTSSGIYRITCLTNKKFYIGSATNIRTRAQLHYNALQRKDHHNPKLQRSWDKYGEQAFTFEILEFVLTPFLLEREQYWLDKLQPFGNRGFNLAVTAGSRLGMKNSPEAIEKTRSAKIGKKRSPETIERIRQAKRINPGGRPLGCEVTPEHREKLRQANLGKKASPKTKRKLSEMHKGKKPSPESIEKTRLANTGRKNSEEAIERMIDAHANDMKTLIATDPNGVEHTVTGIHQFCKEHNLDRRCVQRVASGRFLQHKGWRIRYLDNDVA